jgi:hypothetical protein
MSANTRTGAAEVSATLAHYDTLAREAVANGNIDEFMKTYRPEMVSNVF